MTDCLLVLLKDTSQSRWLRARTATLSRYLSDETHRLRMIGLLDDEAGDVAAPIAQAIGHMPFSAMSDQVLRGQLARELTEASRARMYALGMSGSPGLSAIAGSEQAPEWQRVAAAWWLEQGSAIRPSGPPSR